MIIGIVGTHGAGKGAVVGILKQHGFIHCSARELISEEAKRRGLPLDRKTLGDVGNELREKYGADYVVKTYLAKCDASVNDIVIESIYTKGELEAIRLAGGYVISVDADPEIRYDRVQHRMSSTDAVSKAEFLARQQEELASDDPAKLNARAVMNAADFHVENNGDMGSLTVRVNAILEEIAKDI